MAKKIGFAALSKADRAKISRKGGLARAKQAAAARKPVAKKKRSK